MRLGYVHSTGFPSLRADVVQVVQMCRGFAGLGMDVTLFIPRAEQFASDDEARARMPEMYGGALPFRVEFVPRVRIFGRLEVLGTVQGTMDALHRVPLDLVYTRNPWSVIFLPRVRVPFIFEAHETRLHRDFEWLSTLMRRRVVRNCRQEQCVLVVAISDALRRAWIEFGVPEEKTLTAHDGVDLALFDLSLSRAEARARLAVSTDKPVVVYTGALYEAYGIRDILRAAQQLPEIEFYLVGGNAQDHARCVSEAQTLGLRNVHLPGAVPHREVPVWLAAADVLLMMWSWRYPTMAVCSPMKMFEYMAAERLIVGPAFPTITEVLTHGEDAILFEPDSLEGLIAALKEALARRSDVSMPRAARAKVEREYTWEVRCRRILEAWRKRGFAQDRTAHQGRSS